MESSLHPTVVEHIKDFGSLDDSVKELIYAAIKARKFAYTPYSKFKVGAAFLSKNGQIFTGCNVENAAFTATSCAERTALAKAVSEGAKEFIAGAVVAYQNDSFTSPCGVCRQFIMEFSNEDVPIYLTRDREDMGVKQPINDDEKVLCTSIYNLLPHGFRTYIEG